MKGISLIGMAGVGKSTIGRALSQELNWPMYDIDRMMEEKEGLGIAKIIGQKGREYVANLEVQTIRTLKLEDSILSTPGSIVYSTGCHAYIRKSSHIVYLEAPLQIIEERLAYDPLNTRGVIGLEDGGLAKLFQERKPLYERLAGITIKVQNKSVDEITREILKKI